MIRHLGRGSRYVGRATVPGGETIYYNYDRRGNQTQRKVLGGDTLYFDYNSRNLITRIDSTEDGFTPNSFEYNALGQRIKKVDSTGSTRYVWDGLNITAEYDEEGTIQRRYTHGHTPIHGVFSLISVQDAQGCRYFYHFDQVGGVRALTTQAAATDTTYEYSPFGRILAETAGSAPNDFTFPATYVQLAGVPSFRVSSARLYDARIGRFTSEDALKEHPVPGFAKEAPLRLVDPSGLYVIHTERIRDLRGWLCGVVTVDLNEKGGLTLKFDDSKHQSCARCCPDNEFGWVQHWCWENDEGGLDCVYDNAAYRAPRPLLRMPGEGAPSNPNLPEQPNEENRPRTGHWPGNPWYGGPSSIEQSPDADELLKGGIDTEWPRNPRPRKQIYDRPMIPLGFFIAQLICARGKGRVHFQWKFSSGDPGSRRYVMPEWAREALQGPVIAPVFPETDPFSRAQTPSSR